MFEPQLYATSDFTPWLEGGLQQKVDPKVWAENALKFLTLEGKEKLAKTSVIQDFKKINFDSKINLDLATWLLGCGAGPTWLSTVLAGRMDFSGDYFYGVKRDWADVMWVLRSMESLKNLVIEELKEKYEWTEKSQNLYLQPGFNDFFRKSVSERIDPQAFAKEGIGLVTSLGRAKLVSIKNSVPKELKNASAESIKNIKSNEGYLTEEEKRLQASALDVLFQVVDWLVKGGLSQEDLDFTGEETNAWFLRAMSALMDILEKKLDSKPEV